MPLGRLLLGSSLLLFQVLMIVHGHVAGHRYFCWAVFSLVAPYRITVDVNAAPLTSPAIAARYHVAAKSVELNSITNLFSVIEQYEKTYGRTDRANVVVRYRLNGESAEREWRWPHP
jgi:hypothetical protein